MLRTTLSLLLAGSASAYTLARGPSALSVRPALAKPAQFAPLVRMAEAAAEAAPVEEAPCIEDEAIEECVLASWDAGKLAVPMSWVQQGKLVSLIFGWFFMNVMYNISNKRCLNAFPMPWMMSLTSLFVGIPWLMLLWGTGVRKAPVLKPDAAKTLIPIGFAHALGHAGSVIALGAGAVSFAQTVKAAEPVFTCVLSYLVLGTVFKWQVYASLFPIIAGVSIASLKARSSPTSPSPRAPCSPSSPCRSRRARTWTRRTCTASSRCSPSCSPSPSPSTSRAPRSRARGPPRPRSWARRG